MVFTPPPVEAGEAPMNISKIVTSIEPVLNLFGTIVSKPAVRGVTDANNEAMIFCHSVMPDNVVRYSSAQGWPLLPEL